MSKLWDGVKGVLGAVAPALGTALGGPFGGLAANAIVNALGLDATTTEEQLAKVIKTATPEQLLLIKQADQQFAIRMRELEIDLEKIAGDDRNSARQREASVKDRMPAILASLVTIGFFGVLYYLLENGLPHQGGDALLVMLGSLGTAWTSVVAYYFGSSAGSRIKDLTSLENAKK